MVVRGTYDSIEKIFLTASAFYVCYIIAGLLAHPDWKAAAFATVTRPQAAGSSKAYGRAPANGSDISGNGTPSGPKGAAEYIKVNGQPDFGSPCA